VPVAVGEVDLGLGKRIVFGTVSDRCLAEHGVLGLVLGEGSVRLLLTTTFVFPQGGQDSRACPQQQGSGQRQDVYEQGVDSCMSGPPSPSRAMTCASWHATPMTAALCTCAKPPALSPISCASMRPLA
jgi:hypothetical protein